eukprot:TRINITY_DN30654_c0_g1_i2.p1 TRINITY_DN30654_c0_g1~~TRINITY_DN30654_c0_g1_i2.p1  ORF type:complete len:1528 (+),score=356.29 TRINITY_DN30654_c0_g1_i2:560-4585(+)
MESDGPASLQYKAISKALSDNLEATVGKQRRRLHSESPADVAEDATSSPPRLQRIFDTAVPGLITGDSSGRVLSEERVGYGADKENKGEPQRELQWPGNKLYKYFRVDVTYIPKGSANLLSLPVLRDIRDIEKKLKALPSHGALCNDAGHWERPMCLDGASLANVVFAEAEKMGDGKVVDYNFNGHGEEPIPVAVAVQIAKDYGLSPALFTKEADGNENLVVENMACEDYVGDCARWRSHGQCQEHAEHRMYMKEFCARTCGYCGSSDADEASGKKPLQLRALRSHFVFKALCCFSGQPNYAEALQELKDKWKVFVADFVDLLEGHEERLPENETLDFQMLYNGDDVEYHVVMQAAFGDMLWALCSYAFVCFYATLHTRSFFLAMVGMFLVMLSIPTAVAIFKITSGEDQISLMMLLSIFIVIGVGSDMLFVYTDFWKHSLQHTRDPLERLRFVYSHASISTAATTFTTSMSFMANMASALRPLREFGFFMGVCVVAAWLLMALGYPACLLAGERLHRWLRALALNLCGLGCGTAADAAAEPQSASGDGQPTVKRSSTATSVSSRSSVGEALGSMLDPEKDGIGTLHGTLLGQRLSGLLRARRWLVIPFFFALTGLSLWLAVSMAKNDFKAPKLFSDDHPLEVMKAYEGDFGADMQEAFSFVYYQPHVKQCSNLFGECYMHSCDMYGRPVGGLEACECYQYDVEAAETGQDAAECGAYEVHVRAVAAAGQLQPEAFQRSLHDAFLRSTVQHGWSAARITSLDADVEKSHLLTVDWETGQEKMAEMFTLPRGSITPGDPNEATSNITCWLRHLCHCGVPRCIDYSRDDESFGESTGILATNAQTRRMEEDFSSTPAALEQREPFLVGDEVKLFPRRLAATTIRPELQADVLVVFGIDVVGEQPTLGVSSEPLYTISRSFQLEDPWAQRRSYELCTTWPDDLRVVAQNCWLEHFKAYWTQSLGKDWPVRKHMDFHTQVQTFLKGFLYNQKSMEHFVWFEEERIVAMTYQVYLGISKHSTGEAAEKLHQRWEAYIEDFNDKAKDSFQGVLHASRLWVSLEAQKVILSSTMDTLFISLGCVFLGAVLFTHSLQIATIVMVIVASIIASLLFYMVVVMRWTLGAIEVVSLIIFVGFAVDYCLHLAHKYQACRISGIEELEEAYEHEAGSPSSGRRIDAVMSSGSETSSTRRWLVNISVSDTGTAAAPRLPEYQLRMLSQNPSIERFERTKYALGCMGGAILGSALTTIGCACFLLPCMLRVFNKIGSVVIGVTIYAAIYALLPLPAILLTMGPCESDISGLLLRCEQMFPAGLPEFDEDLSDDEAVQAPSRERPAPDAAHREAARA